MVDVDGVLYTIDLYGMGSQGANFYIRKYTSSTDGSSISSISKNYYPWTKCGNTVNAGSTPNLHAYGYDDESEGEFKNKFHNCLQPCIAQELSPTKSEKLSVFFRTPPGRYYGLPDEISNEGILYQDFNKSNLQETSNVLYWSSSANVYWYGWSRWRRFDDSYQYAMEKGNYKAWKYGDKIHLDFIARNCGTPTANEPYREFLQHQYNSSWGSRSSIKPYHWTDIQVIFLCPRYIYDSGNVYSLTGANYYPNLNAWTVDSDITVRKVCANTPMIYLETTRWGHSESPYDYDFFIETGADGTKIFCFLAFGGGGSYTANSSNYNWSSTYCNWTLTYATLLLSSLPFSTGGNRTSVNDTFGTYYNEDLKEYYYDSEKAGDWAQNVIYIAPYSRASGNYVNASNTSKGQEYRLYQNTHRMVRYVSSTGNKYIIYCYCYPGKEPQLYLGYAQYWIDSANKIMLGPKCEFRRTANQWSESIANCFTSCSRIISMDCRAGHLWITWMNEDNSEYRYFHILAKDLVGE